MSKIIKSGLILCVLVVFVSCQSENLLQLATKLGLTELVKLIKQAGLAGTLSKQGPYTLLAPTDQAFRLLPESVFNHIVSNKKVLIQTLQYHLLKGTVMSTDFKNDFAAQTELQFHDVRINIYDGISVQNITANGRRIGLVDQVASNGVIHELDRVLYPIPDATIIDFVYSNTTFSRFFIGAQKVNLGSTFGDRGPFTAFVPTNLAFTKLPAAFLEKLWANATALKAVLEYHMIRGAFYSQGLASQLLAPSLQGDYLDITSVGSEVTVNNEAHVKLLDVTVTNGVVHVIDTVLIPPSVH